MKKYPKEFQEYAIRAMELLPDDLKYMTRNEMLDAYLEHEGYGKHAGYFIRATIKNIYGIDLSNYTEYLLPEVVAEMDECSTTRSIDQMISMGVTLDDLAQCADILDRITKNK